MWARCVPALPPPIEVLKLHLPLASGALPCSPSPIPIRVRRVAITLLQVANRGLCAVAQAESMRYKLLGGLAVRRACYGVLRFVMESGEILHVMTRRLTSMHNRCMAFNVLHSCVS